jgi:hypothetical protein
MVRKIRADSRVANAEEWPVADGKVSRLVFSKRGSLIRPTLSYSFEVNGETHYGAAQCIELREDLEGEATESVNALHALRVRFDPDDPFRSRLINEDNPGLRLKIDHDAW